MIWPITMRLRSNVEPAHVLACAAVKQGAAPQGPFAPVICAGVSRLSLSLSPIRTSRIAVSSS